MSVKDTLITQLKAWDDIFSDTSRLFLPEIQERVVILHGDIENSCFTLTNSVQSTAERKALIDNFAYLRNLLQSWSEGVSRNCLTTTDAENLKTQWQLKSSQLKDQLADIVELETKAGVKGKAKKNTLFTTNNKLKRKAMAESDNPFDGSEFLADADELLAKMAAIRAELPSANARNALSLIVVQSSIIPQFEPYVSAEDLKRLSYKADQLGTYIVLHNQVLIGVSRKWCRDNNMDTSNVHELFDNTIKELSEKHHVRYMRGHNKILTDIETGYQYCWLVSESSMDLFLSALQAKPVDWGLLS